MQKGFHETWYCGVLLRNVYILSDLGLNFVHYMKIYTRVFTHLDPNSRNIYRNGKFSYKKPQQEVKRFILNELLP
jgi:hypothetical protein